MIAVIDTGVHFNHPFLRDQMALNEKEIPGNNLDDDGNGYVDDVMGWDFQHGDPSPFDDVGHGSHVAGLAAGSRFGLAQKSKILSVKALGAFGGDVGSVAAAIRYAVDRGAQIVNLSLGTHSNPKQELLAAVDYAERKGVLLVTAAGNGDPMTRIGIDTDEYPLYPAGLPNRNILNVASQGAGDGLALYSNYGKKSVDVAATGGDSSAPLYSTFLDNPAGLAFQPMWGTSMAAPVAAGIAAQVWSANSKASALQVKMHMLRSGKRHPGLSGAILSGRGLDALTALQRKFN